MPSLCIARMSFFLFDIVDEVVIVTTCSREGEMVIDSSRVSVFVDEDFDCMTNRPIINRR